MTFDAIAGDPHNPDRFWLGNARGLWRSKDGGKAITKVADATVTHYEAGLIKNGRGVLRSTHGGRTWENVSAGLQNHSATSLAFSSDGQRLFAGTTRGGGHRLHVD